jgi:hypothetical protein
VPTYQPALVTFLDVLGFRELVLQNDPSVVHAKLKAVERFTRPSALPYGDDDGLIDPMVLQFSDAIVRTTPITPPSNTNMPSGVLFYELLDLVRAQGELILQGVLIRGEFRTDPCLLQKTRLLGLR